MFITSTISIVAAAERLILRLREFPTDVRVAMTGRAGGSKAAHAAVDLAAITLMPLFRIAA